MIDLDATDLPVHGRQEGRSFHGYQDHYGYLSLYIFCGEHLLGARLRRSNIDASAGAIDELAPIVERSRVRWPRTRIVIRADSGFCRDAILSWCESNGVEYVIGLAKNSRLLEMAEGYMGLAQCAHASAVLQKGSAQTLHANQVRLYFASIACTLLHALRRIGRASPRKHARTADSMPLSGEDDGDEYLPRRLRAQAGPKESRIKISGGHKYRSTTTGDPTTPGRSLARRTRAAKHASNAVAPLSPRAHQWPRASRATTRPHHHAFHLSSDRLHTARSRCAARSKLQATAFDACFAVRTPVS